MTEAELMTWLLQQIDFRKGDDWSHPTCSGGHLGIADDLAPAGSEGRQAWRLEFGE